MIRVVKPDEVERPVIKKIVKDLAEYYSTSLSDRQIDMYVEDLLEMGSELTYEAVLKYRRRLDSSTFPLPSKIRSQVGFGLKIPLRALSSPLG